MFGFLVLVVYKAILDSILWWAILPVYGGEVFLDYGSLDAGRMCVGYLLLIPLWLALRLVGGVESNRVSRLVLMVQALLIVVPAFSLYSQSERPIQDIALIVLGFVLVVLFLCVLPRIRIPLPGKMLNFLLIIVAVFLLLYVLGGLAVAGGLSRLNFNLYSVYETRDLYVQSRLPMFGYFLSWVVYVVNMGFLVFFSVKRKYVGLIAVLIAQVLIFGMTNFKTILFLPFVVLGVLWAARRFNFERIVLFGAGAIALSLTVIGFSGELMGFGIARRLFFVPSALHTLYFDYFSMNPLALMSGSGIGELLDAPYDQSPVYIIANEYWGKEFAPNVGWLGAAFANFGVLGVLFFSFLLAVYLKAADSIAGYLPFPGIAEALFIAPAFTLCSSAFNTFLLTHGGILVLVTLWVLAGMLAVRPKLTGICKQAGSDHE